MNFRIPIFDYEATGSPKWTLEKVLRGTSDAHIKFADLRNLLLHLGFEEKIKASHHIYRRADVSDK